MLAQLTQRKTSEVRVFQLRKKKGSMPTRKKIVGSGAFPELLRSFYGELLRRTRFFPQIFKFGSRGVKVYGQSLWSLSPPLLPHPHPPPPWTEHYAHEGNRKFT
jgi:hypothetical protein